MKEKDYISTKTDSSMNTNEAKEIIEEIAKEKQYFFRGGGKDFQGALKRLVGIWSDPSHALIGLLQNADYADATMVKYKIFPNGIIFEHDGHPFIHNDEKSEIRAICSVDASTKDAEKHTGFMGIGFKAVFKLSTSPFIICPPWKFHFCPDRFDPSNWGWILIPRWVDYIPEEIGEVPNGRTVFWLPYKEELSVDATKLIEGEIFERFDSLCLIFLRKVTQIQIESSDGRTRKLCLEGDTVIEEKDGKETRHRYKVFRKLFQIPDYAKVGYLVQDSGRDKAKVREIVLAFATDSKGNLQPKINFQLYTFLPTDYFPGLRFAVQGDFILDTQRSRVDESLEWNRWLWRCVKELLQGAIEGFDNEGNHVKGFKDDEEMRYQFYCMLPSKDNFPSTEEKSIIRTELIEPFWKYCRENPIIITSRNTWIKPSEAVLTSPELLELLDTAKLKDITGREHFVHPKVHGVKEFFSEIGVSDLPEQEFLEALKDETWMNSKEIEWFRKLYSFLWDCLYDEKKRWNDWWRQKDLVRSLPIVRTSQGIVKKPDEVLFLPEKEEEIKLATGIPGVLFVDRSFIEDDTRKFLEELGVQIFSAESVIKTVILKGFEDETWQNWTEEQYDKCVRFVREWLKGQEWKLPTELQRKVGAVRVKTESNTLERADKCYFSELKLKLLYPEANFVKLDEGNEEQRDFLLSLGVKERPRLFVDDKQYERTKGPDFVSRWNNYWSWLSNRNDLPRYSRGVKKVPYIDSWDEMQWTPKVGETMLEYFVTYWEDDYKPHIESSYAYRPPRCQHDRTQKIPSYFTYQLLEIKWLPTTKELMKPSKEIFVSLPKIKKVAGDLISYISIPEGWKEQEFLSQGQEVFRFLGLRAELDIGALKYLLEIAREHPVDGNLKLYLSRIYQALGRLLEEENESELDKLKLLTRAGTFEDSLCLYWNDDPDLCSHFQDAEELHLAWIPDGVERKHIEILFQKAGVKALSKHVQRKLVTPTIAEPNEKLTDLPRLQEKARYIYSLLKHHKADKADIAGEKLTKAQVKSFDKLEVLLSLDGIQRSVMADVFYDAHGDILYLTKDVENFEIALELARVFGLDFGYMADIEVILREKDDRIEERLQRQGIALLNWEPQPPLPPVTEETEKEQKDRGKEGRVGPIVVAPTQDASTNSVKLGTSTGGRTSEPSGPNPIGTSRQVQRIGLPYDERMKEEALNIEQVIKFEEKQGRRAEDVSKEFRGFDLESIDITTDEIRCIEVKAPSFVMLTPHEYKVAKEKGTSYYIYIVDGGVIYIVQDPANSCNVIEIETLETRWKILGWMENAKKYELSM